MKLKNETTQIKALRVTPLDGVSTSTVAPVEVAHTCMARRNTWISLQNVPRRAYVLIENLQGFSALMKADLV